jgi:hypothetical protein
MYMCMDDEKFYINEIIETNPNWITSILINFATDYDMFNQTWNKLCYEIIKTTPKEIMLVNDIVDKTALCDDLTSKGYCIRLDTQFQPCKGNCKRAIASHSFHEFLTSKGFSETWSEYCKECLN